ncbi:MAG: arylamine N-acetyltransferase [Chloroflexi bacterium]|nr:MAG: arylamine N-acetyltransferase [Chloroflexota bacterium]
MMSLLSNDDAHSILHYLGCTAEQPSVAAVNRLVAAYVRRVPWETAFRIVRRAQFSAPQECPRWPHIFWDDAIHRGGGGTCFESNYAFFALLRALGYEGYLTINNMDDDGSPNTTPSIGCHSAIVLLLNGDKWLVDVGLPVYCALPIIEGQTTTAYSDFHRYTVSPDGDSRYHILRDGYPKPNCFTLIDKPVSDDVYRQRVIRDYGPDGLFLSHIIINLVIGNVPYRFSSADVPYHLEYFLDGVRHDTPLPDDIAQLSQQLAQHFSMDVDTLQKALAIAAIAPKN